MNLSTASDAADTEQTLGAKNTLFLQVRIHAGHRDWTLCESLRVRDSDLTPHYQQFENTTEPWAVRDG